MNFNDDDGLPNAKAARKIAQRTLTHFITFAMNDPHCALQMSGVDCSGLLRIAPGAANILLLGNEMSDYYRTGEALVTGGTRLALATGDSLIR